MLWLATGVAVSYAWCRETLFEIRDVLRVDFVGQFGGAVGNAQNGFLADLSSKKAPRVVLSAFRVNDPALFDLADNLT